MMVALSSPDDSAGLVPGRDTIEVFSQPTQAGQFFDDRGTLLIAQIMASLGGFSNGFITYVNGSLVALIQKDRGFEHYLDGVLTGSIIIGSGLGSILGGHMADARGRRQASMIGELIIIASSLLGTISPHPGAIITSRIVTGIGCGICQAVKPIFVSELAPSNARGRALALFQLMYSLGIATVKLVDYVLQKCAPALVWRLLVALGALPAFILLLVLGFCAPESPVWLANLSPMHRMSNNNQHAVCGCLDSLSTFQRFEDKTAQVQAQCPDNVSVPEEAQSLWSQLEMLLSAKRSVRKPMLVAAALIAAMQGTGSTVLIMKSADFMAKAGAGDDAAFYSIFIGVAHVVGASGAVAMTDTLNRRPMLLGGLWVLLFLATLLGVLYSVGSESAMGVSIATIYLYVIVWTSTVAPMLTVIVTEVIYKCIIHGQDYTLNAYTISSPINTLLFD